MPKKAMTARVCSFCGQPESPTRRMIDGEDPNVHICEVCASVCNQFFDLNIEGGMKPLARDLAPKSFTITQTPEEIKNELDQYVVGQEEAKKVLAVAVYNHYKRVENNLYAKNDLELEKSNVLMIGPTGSGKTLLARTLARIINVPFAIADATNLTAAGYYGEDVESVLQRLLAAASFDRDAAERGIVYIDEFDKLGRKTDVPRSGRDIGGEAVQQEFLKMLEGNLVTLAVNGKQNGQQDTIQMDTTNVLFICGGSFEGLTEIVSSRLGGSSIGFGKAANATVSPEAPYLSITHDDIRKFGIIPEIVGRLPVIAPLLPLSEDDLVHILTDPKNALLKQYEALLAMDGATLLYTPEALQALAHKAHLMKTGARGLRTLFEETMLDLMYALPSLKTATTVTVTPEVINGTAKPVIVPKTDVKERIKTR